MVSEKKMENRACRPKKSGNEAVRPKSKTRPRRTPYSKGELNRLIDDLLHPLAKGDAETPVLILDESLHALVEQNPTESLRKFVKYTLPRIVKKHLDSRG